MKQIRDILIVVLSMTASFASASSLDVLRTVEAFASRHQSLRNPEPGACDWQKSRSTCSNSSDAFTFQGCTVAGGKILLEGSLNETFTGNQADKCTLPLVEGESVTHTSNGLVLQYASRESLALDTASATAYDGTLIPATGVISAFAAGVTTVTITGAHAIVKDPEGKVSEELLAISTAPMMMSGLYEDGTFAINDGAVRAFHQVDKYTSDAKFEKLAWSDKACCHPVAGKISEVMSGSKTGTRSLAFGAKCGTAVMTNADGTSQNIELPACQ